MITACLFIAAIALYWLAAAALFGFAEAYYFYHLNQAYDKRGRIYDHAFLTALRAMLAAPLLLHFYDNVDKSPWPTFFMLLFMLLSFPYIHDGFQYSIHNRLDKGTYPDGWKSSVDGRALFDLSYNSRLILFMASMVWLGVFLIMEAV
ncbi:MAG: hypothetical protein V9G42_06125 [Bacteroidia bacterium]